MGRTTAAVRKSQAERRDEAQRRLVEATLAVIAADGVSAATFEAVGQRAGYSRGLATQHFGSKQGLIEAVIDYLHERQDAALEAAHVDEMDGLEALLAYVGGFIEALRRDADYAPYFMLLAGAVADAGETRTLFARSHAKVKTRLARLIKRGQTERRIRADIDPESAAVMVGSMLLGLSMQMLVDPGTRPGAVGKAMQAQLRRSFAAPTGKPAGRRVCDG